MGDGMRTNTGRGSNTLSRVSQTFIQQQTHYQAPNIYRGKTVFRYLNHQLTAGCCSLVPQSATRLRDPLLGSSGSQRTNKSSSSCHYQCHNTPPLGRQGRGISQTLVYPVTRQREGYVPQQTHPRPKPAACMPSEPFLPKKTVRYWSYDSGPTRPYRTRQAELGIGRGGGEKQG